MTTTSWILAATVLLLGTVSAVACQGNEVLYEENFDEEYTTWDPDGDIVKLDGGKLIVSPKPSKSHAQLTLDEIFDDMDFCASMTPIKAPDPNTASGALIFWWQDWKNFYQLQLTPAGDFSVVRFTRGRALWPVQWTKADSIKTGEGAVNNLRILVVGRRAKIFINGKQVASFKGRPPKDGSFLGVLVVSPANGRTVVAYEDFKVTMPVDAVAARQSGPSDRDESQKSELMKAAKAAGMRTTSVNTGAALRPSP